MMQTEKTNKGIITEKLKVGYDGHIIVPSFDIQILSLIHI